jgi:hypothetical protein
MRGRVFASSHVVQIMDMCQQAKAKDGLLKMNIRIQLKGEILGHKWLAADLNGESRDFQALLFLL